MTSVATRRPVADALLVMLRARTTPDGVPLRVGDHHAPETPGEAAQAETPYAIVHGISSVLTGPPFGDPHADGRFVFQITSVGTNRRSAEALADVIRAAILTLGPNGYLHPITLTGAEVMGRELEFGGPVTQHGAFWNVVDQFALQTTPHL